MNDFILWDILVVDGGKGIEGGCLSQKRLPNCLNNAGARHSYTTCPNVLQSLEQVLKKIVFRNVRSTDLVAVPERPY